MTQALVLSLIVSAIVPKSMQAYEYAYRQQRDASCGYAVVASTLSLYCGVPADEEVLLKEFASEEGDGEIDFNTMKRMFASREIAAKGFRMTLEELRNGINTLHPLIIHYVKPHRHFALLLAVIDEGFVIADSAAGLTLVPPAEFSSRWSGMVLAVAVPRERAGTVCERAADYAQARLRLLERSSCRL